MALRVLNRIDERGRFRGLTFGEGEPAGQFDSHGFSSAYLLNQMRELEDTIFINSEGGEKPDFKYEWENKSRGE